MRYAPSAEEIGDRDIEYAARYGKPTAPLVGAVLEGEHYLHIPRTRTVPLPEPVATDVLNGRQPEAWEEPLIVAARERERRLELVLLRGLVWA